MEPTNTPDYSGQAEVKTVVRSNFLVVCDPLCRVTSLSKILAAVLFIILPFVGAYIGYQYASNEVGKDVNFEALATVMPVEDSQLSEKISQVKELYYFTSLKDVSEYISGVEDPHLDWKTKASDKLQLIENVTFVDPSMYENIEKFSQYFLLVASTSDELTFSRGSLIKGGEPVGIFKLNKSNNSLMEISNTQTDQNIVFNDPEFGFSFSYPSSWGSIKVNSGGGSCTDEKQECKFYTFAPSNDPAGVFLVAQTQEKPLSGRGAFWGDFMNYSSNKEIIDLCRANASCAVVSNSHNLNFTKQANIHSCEQGEGCEGEGDYYELFHPGSDLVKFSLATYRLTDEDKKNFEDTVINSFEFKK